MTPLASRMASIGTFAVTVAIVCAFVAIAYRRPPVVPVGFGTNDYIGRPAPDFTLPNLKGEPVALSSLKGQVVVLDLWATWCPPCVEELPILTEVTAKYADRGVAFHAINISDSADVIRKFLDDHKLSPPVLLDPSGKTAEAYGAMYIPLTVVIDRTGRIVAHGNVSPDEAKTTLTRWIESALQSGQAK